MAKVDYKNNIFSDSYSIALKTKKEKDEYLDYLKLVIDKPSNFYAKIVEIYELCSKVKIEGLEVLDDNTEVAFHIDML